jgi:ABC-type amino acid transport substrate-binding protein
MSPRRVRVAGVLLAVGLVAVAIFAGAGRVLGQSPSTLDQIKSRGVLRVGWGVWFPYVYRDPQTKEVRGISIDIFQEMAKDLGVRPEFVEDSWGTMVAGLQARKFDVLNLLAITEERKQAADFSKPVLRFGMGFLVLKTNADKYRTWQDFDKPDRKVVVTLGSSTDVFATRTLKQAQILRVKGQDDQVLQILAGRADAQFSSVDSMTFIARAHPELTLIKVPEFPASDVALGMPKGDTAFREWVDKFIDRQKAGGGLRRIVEKNGLDATFIID